MDASCLEESKVLVNQCLCCHYEVGQNHSFSESDCKKNLKKGEENQNGVNDAQAGLSPDDGLKVSRGWVT